MMASIPNMRSTPLPVPTGKTGNAEAAPGDFAAQLPVPAAPGQPGQPGECMPAPALPADLLMPAPITAEDGEGESIDTPETQPETAEGEQPQAAVIIPFLPIQPAPQQPKVAAADVPATPAPDKVVQAPVGKADGPETDLPLPAVAATDGESENKPIDAARIEAAIKDLMQRKQLPTRQVPASAVARSADPAKPEAGPAQAQAAPAPVQAPVAMASPLPVIDQAQPALAPNMTQPAPIRADAPATVGGTRTEDLAVERQLDLARDTEWLDRLARDIARAGSSDTPLRFKLHPQTLGHLMVELQQGDRGTAIRLTVETEAARQILADAQPRLAAEARAQGVRIAETHVDLSGSGRHAPGDQRRQDEAHTSPMIRTAAGAGEEAVAASRSSSRAHLDRYA